MESDSDAASSDSGPAETDSPVASSAAEHGVGGSSFGAAEASRRDCGDDSEEDSGEQEASPQEISKQFVADFESERWVRRQRDLLARPPTAETRSKW